MKTLIGSLLYYAYTREFLVKIVTHKRLYTINKLGKHARYR